MYKRWRHWSPVAKMRYARSPCSSSARSVRGHRQSQVGWRRTSSRYGWKLPTWVTNSKPAKRNFADIQQELEDILTACQTMVHESVPVGNTEDDNVEIRRWESRTLRF